MIERRSAARFLALIVAGLAVAGTAAATPVPAPTQVIALNGSLHLTADSPVALQPIHLAPDLGDVDQVTIDAALKGLPAEGSVLVSIESPTAVRLAGEAIAPRRAADAVSATSVFPFACSSRPCSGEYVLVATWAGAPAGGTADVVWSASVVARFRTTTGGASAAPGRITVRADPADAGRPASAKVATVSGGAAVHLTETDRFRAWTLSLHRDASTGSSAATNAVTQGRLRFDVSQTDGPAFFSGSTKDRRIELRSDPPVQIRLLAGGRAPVVRWASDGDIDLDPFAACEGAVACDAEMTVELAWADGRPDTAFDAALALDLTSIGLAGTVEPIATEVAQTKAPALADATSSGTFTLDGPAGSAQTELRLSGAPIVDQDSPWMQLGIPARASITIHVVSLGATPLPPNAIVEISAFGEPYTTGSHLATKVEVPPGGTASLALEPTLVCATTYPTSCRVDGSLRGRVFDPSTGAALPADARIRVDWTMDLGLAVAADPGIRVAIDPLPSVAPSTRP